MRIKSFFYSVFCLLTWNEVCAQNNLIWASYYGGTGDERSFSTATDAFGNVFMAGYTDGQNGIASGGFQNVFGGGFSDAYLVKFDAAGNRLWATYYGGAGFDQFYGVTTDGSGNVIVVGSTTSTSNMASGGFQNTYAGNQDAFLVKFDGAGNRLWASYYGGASADELFSVCTDASGNIYGAGRTSSSTNISFNGFQNTFGGAGTWDSFLVKFDAAGTRLWATYYGGSGTDEGYAVSSDAAGNIYFSGMTDNTSGIASGGFQNTLVGPTDAFLVKFDGPTGNRIWATYFGGTGTENGYCLANDPSGNILMAGATSSASGVSSGGFQNAFAGGTFDTYLVKFSPAGARLWATYYGGTGNDEILYDGLAVDVAGNAYMVGDSYSANTGNSIASGGFQNSLVGQENQFLAKFDPAGSRLCATYFGQFHEEYGSVAVDNSGNIYMSGITPSASGISSGGFQNTFGGGPNDAYVAKFSSCFNNILSVNTSQTNILCNGVCVGTATVTPVSGTAPYTYAWSNSQTTSAITGLCAGSYSVIVTDGVGSTAIANFLITQPAAVTASATVTSASCGNSNGTATVAAGGGTPGYTYSWSTGQTASMATGLAVGNYSVIVSDANGCTQTHSVTITPAGSFSLAVSSTQAGCVGNPGTASATPGNGTTPYSYLWSNGQTTSMATGLSSGIYSVTVTDAGGCTQSQTVSVTQTPGASASASASPASISSGASATLSATGGGTYLWNNGATDALILVTPSVTTVYCVTVTDTNGCVDSTCITVVVTTEPLDCSGAGELYLPNAFSPNNDGENEYLKLFYGNMDCLRSVRLMIYNRWGEKVFEATDPTAQWDGTFKGKAEDAAVFAYYLEAIPMVGDNINKKGNISLIR